MGGGGDKGGFGGSSSQGYGDILNFSDAFKDSSVRNYVANLGAGGSASGSPTSSQSGAGFDIGKWLPWIGGGLLVWFIVKRYS